MTYLQFHLVFILPVIALLYLSRPRPLGGNFAAGPWVRLHLGLLPVVAILYTTPWDNYLVYRGIWSYPDERVWFRIGYVPFEEYVYFVLMTLLTSLLALRFFHTHKPQVAGQAPRWIGTMVCLGLTLGGILLLFAGERWLYMGLVLAYFAPVLLLHWVFGGDLIWAAQKPAFASVAISTLYLWFSDWFAITQAGIWQISEVYTSGVRVLGLELEEMLFFLIVNLVIVQSFVLLCHPVSHQRLARWHSNRSRPSIQKPANHR